MYKSEELQEFEKSVRNKFEVYNSLFLNLPFKNIRNIGMYIPLMQRICKDGLGSGKGPIEILDPFFKTIENINTEEDKIDFIFRVIQYIERQIVLFDSIEDAAFPNIQKLSNELSLSDIIHLSESKSLDQSLSEKISEFSARIVLTAHPTQFYSHSVLDIIGRLRTLITENDINEIDLTLQQLGLTSLINSKKPTPLDEAKNVIYFLRNIYYDAVGELYSYIKKNIKDPAFDNSNIIKIGFWPGGDRDGNPFVNSEITLQVADELRMSLMKCYYKDIKLLEQRLTFRDVEELISDLREKIYTAMFDASKKISYDEIINELHRIKEIVIHKYNGLSLDLIDGFIDKVKIFKTHFAELDIRQNHSVHLQIIEEVFKKKKLISKSLDELNEKELVKILSEKQSRISPNEFSDPIIKDTIKLISQLKTIQNKNGEDGCHRYIISNSEDIFSVLFVYKLFELCGWQREKISFDIVPLFETMDGMKNAESIVKNLFENLVYLKHLKHRRNIQTIMLGFSDGTKDGGYLKANWSIFKTKEVLSDLGKQYNIKVVFFDGRGGPPARGGGKTHKFYAAQSDKIANQEIQLTIQGQTISSKYGTKEHFFNNFEQLITAGLSNMIFPSSNIISDKSRALIEELSEISFKKYFSLKNHNKFISYLENKSPLKYYGKTNIGSRPAKRGSKQKLEFKDLRAIPFVGSWSQLKQNVPGYYGVGTALKTLADKGKLNELKLLFNEVPFFKALMLNSMMSLSKSYFELTSYFKKDKNFKDFWKLLFDEYKLSKEMLLKISGFKSLMEEEPVSKNSIEIRERIVLPLLVIQQYALQKIERNSEYKKIYEKIVRRSLYGNINASRNSA